MAKYKVQVRVIAELSYNVEVESDSEANAEHAATLACKKHMPSDFNVNVDYVTAWETDTDQLTAICPGCHIEHIVLHAELPICYCNQFGHNPYGAMRDPPTRNYISRPHLIVDGACTPEPWWWNDSEYCAACGAKIELEDKLNGR